MHLGPGQDSNRELFRCTICRAKKIDFSYRSNKVKWPISGHCLARSGLHAPSAKTNEPRALALQSLILLGILFPQEEVGVEDSMLLGSKN